MEKIETQLKRLSPQLSMHDSQVLWSRVQGSLAPRRAKSPKKGRSLFRALTAGFVILGLLGGSVVTAYASEALPGDALYSTKITIERAKIVLAPVEKKKDLQLAYADRRIKEVTAVLSDIEEEPAEEAADSALMAVSAPLPEIATMAFALPSEEPSADDVQMMKAVPMNEPMEGEKENVQDPMTMSAVADIPTESTDSAPVVAPMNSQVSQRALGQETEKQQKRWKNLDKKKKALAAAIKELERSRADLQESGATSTSQNIDAVIVNLTELNASGTTPDVMFVEKAKNSEIEVVEPEEQEHATEEVRSNDKDDDLVLSMEETQKAQVAAVFQSAIATSSKEVEEEVREMVEVRERNEERRKRIQNDDRKRKKDDLDAPSVSRVPVCTNVNGRNEELLVLKKNLSRYLDRGFTQGTCPPVAVPLSTSTPDEVSEGEKEGILDE